MSKKTQYIPYIKYVIAPGGRFERDAKIFFDPEGQVSKGETLQNYGWNQTGFKELIEAFYFSEKGSVKGFKEYFDGRIKYAVDNIVDILRRDEMIEHELRGLIRLKLRDNMAIPALLVEILAVRYKYCLRPSLCKRLWRSGKPPTKLEEFLNEHSLTNSYAKRFRCVRHLCYELCGEYQHCELMYTSVEGDKETDGKILDCIIDLIKQIELKEPGSKKCKCRPWTPEDHAKKPVGRLKPESKCFERPVRFDFKPLRYYILDHKTWKEIEKRRYNKNPNNQFDAFPAPLLPHTFDDRFMDSTELSAPLRAPGILECFLRLTAVKFELKHDLVKECSICDRIHRITDIPIKAMFRRMDDEVYCQEMGFAELLWGSLWEKYPNYMCKSFQRSSRIKSSDSKIIKRELRAGELTESRYPESSYDFAVNIRELTPDRNELFVFDLTTALWKKSGFHETSRPPQEHLNRWKEMLCTIPTSLPNLFALWYVVTNDVEDNFFDPTAPKGAKNMKELVALVTEKHLDSSLILRQPSDIDSINIKRHKLLIIPVFNSTPRKGEARYELRRLFKRDFSKLLIKQVIDLLL